MSTFLDRIKERAKAEKKTIVLPESMDRRTFEAAEKVLKEDIANIIIIGTDEEVAAMIRRTNIKIILLSFSVNLRRNIKLFIFVTSCLFFNF